MNKRFVLSISIAALSLIFFTTASFAQEEGEMAEAAQNPVANMYSMPFQFNSVFGVGDWQTRVQLTFMYPTKSMKAKMKAAGAT